jgi:pimeloyl-ACP methyl ester carboxylesterase
MTQNLLEDLHVTRWGSGSPVLLIHGGPQGGPNGGENAWGRQRPLADEGWELVLPDRPGHARSPSRGPESIERDAAWVAEMLGDGMHLVGHSYGGCIATEAAGLRPEAVRSLTVVEAAAASVAPDHPAVVANRQAMVTALIAAATPRERYLAFARYAGIPPAMSESLDEATQTRMGEGLLVMQTPAQWDARPALTTIADAGIPFLTVTGGWSESMAAIADALAAQLDGSHVVLETGHHFPQFHPDFNQTVAGFLVAAQGRASGAG